MSDATVTCDYAVCGVPGLVRSGLVWSDVVWCVGSESVRDRMRKSSDVGGHYRR